MSHSKHTEPYLPRLLGKGRAMEVHDHRAGECDLPDLQAYVRGTTSRTHCYWDLSRTELYVHPVCGCVMCTDRETRREDRRKERHTAAAQIREQLADRVIDGEA